MFQHVAYFYTETINHFFPLLSDEFCKKIVIESLRYLIQKNKIIIYGYVIMPNHIHLNWNMLEQNGKESPSGSFAKYTAHAFKKYLSESNAALLKQFISDIKDRAYQFWKRDPLAIPITSEKNLIQKTGIYS